MLQIPTIPNESWKLCIHPFLVSSLTIVFTVLVSMVRPRSFVNIMMA